MCSESISGISDAPTAHPGSDVEATEAQVLPDIVATAGGNFIIGTLINWLK